MKLLIAGSMTLVASAAGAFAAEAPAGSCQALVAQGSCVYASALEGGDAARIGTLSRIEGRVMASDVSGYTPAKTDMSLKIGDRVLVLEGGKAVLEAGPYSQALTAPSVIDASAMGECGCLTVQSEVRTFAQAVAGAGAAGAASAGGGAGGAAGAGAAGAAAGAGAAGAGAGGLGAGLGAGLVGSVAGGLGVSATAVVVGGAVVAGAVVAGTVVAVESTTTEDEPSSP